MDLNAAFWKIEKRNIRRKTASSDLSESIPNFLRGYVLEWNLEEKRFPATLISLEMDKIAPPVQHITMAWTAFWKSWILGS